jgi:hypothetical protein
VRRKLPLHRRRVDRRLADREQLGGRGRFDELDAARVDAVALVALGVMLAREKMAQVAVALRAHNLHALIAV